MLGGLGVEWVGCWVGWVLSGLGVEWVGCWVGWVLSGWLDRMGRCTVVAGMIDQMSSLGRV